MPVVTRGQREEQTKLKLIFDIGCLVGREHFNQEDTWNSLQEKTVSELQEYLNKLISEEKAVTQEEDKSPRGDRSPNK